MAAPNCGLPRPLATNCRSAPTWSFVTPLPPPFLLQVQRQQQAGCRADDRMAGAIGRPLLSRRPDILAPRRASAADDAAPVAASSHERTCRGHCPAVGDAGAIGATINAANSPIGRGARAAADGNGSRGTRGRTTDTANWCAIGIAATHVSGATSPGPRLQVQPHHRRSRPRRRPRRQPPHPNRHRRHRR
jgi:hypothetical protein